MVSIVEIVEVHHMGIQNVLPVFARHVEVEVMMHGVKNAPISDYMIRQETKIKVASIRWMKSLAS